MNRILFFLKILFFPYKLKVFKKIELNELKSFSEVSKINFSKRKEIVLFAYMYIPFYRNFYDSHSFNPSQLISEKDWNLIPIIDKQIIKEHRDSIINPFISKNRLNPSTTGGSTGVPLKVFFDKEVPLEVFGWRTMKWWGIFPWENQAYVYRNVRKGLLLFINHLFWWPTKRVLLDCSSMNSYDIDRFISKINRIRPSFIQGYVGGIYDFAKYVSENNVKVHSPKAIWVTAAPLSESTRKFIEGALKAPVYDQYGCSEIFWLAAECKEKRGLHVLSDVRHVEFLDSFNQIVKKGEFGDVVITDLENRAFPLIRYKNGDSGRYLKRNTCSCGLPFPLIDKIKGRISDTIKTPTGILLNGAYLTTIFDDYVDLVDGFQIVQYKDYSVSVNCVISRGQNFQDLRFAKIRNELLKKSNYELEVKINFVDSLSQDRGKLKFIISEL